MDTSEKYIKMCEKAEEIQKLWLRKGLNSSRDFYIWKHEQKRTKPIWFPRQDQLQEMGNWAIGEKVSTFEKFCFRGYKKRGSWMAINSFSSMEQLWLAFVMKEKFNKTWDDEKQEWH